MKQTVNLIYTRRAMSGLLLGAALLLVTPANAEDIYKWVSDDNQVHYTQMPPPHGIKAIRIQRSDVTAREESAQPAEAMDGTEQASIDASPDEQPESVDDEAGASEGNDDDVKIAQAMQENCNNARKNLKALNRGQVRYVTPDGGVIRLTEEQRQQRIEEAEGQIESLCKE
jgi:hypothetical protein